MDKEKTGKRNIEKMTVVDTLQAAYAKQDLSPEAKEYMQRFFQGEVDWKNVSKDDVEKLFAVLREISDKVAKINSRFPSDLDLAFRRLIEFWDGLKTVPVQSLAPDVRMLYFSHITFHRETIADIIAEARELLMEDRREYLKRLVQYHREFVQWLHQLEKKFL